MKGAHLKGIVGALGAALQRMETNVMNRFQLIAVLMMTLGLTGCAESKYPISGETCGPQDPVKTLDARDCTVLPGI